MLSLSTGMAGPHLPKSITEVWLTPPAVLEALGPFDLDPCAAPEPRPWPTASVHYTEQQDGLSLPWYGRVWVNPPYSTATVGIWLEKLADHGCGTALIFARTETKAFHAQVWQRATSLFFFAGRLFFHHSDGSQAKHNAGAPSVLIAYGAEDAKRLEQCNLDGFHVRLR